MCVCVSVCVCVCMCVRMYSLTPPYEQDATLGQFFRLNSTGMKSEMSPSYTGRHIKGQAPVYPTI